MTLLETHQRYQRENVVSNRHRAQALNEWPEMLVFKVVDNRSIERKWPGTLTGTFHRVPSLFIGVQRCIIRYHQVPESQNSAGFVTFLIWGPWVRIPSGAPSFLGGFFAGFRSKAALPPRRRVSTPCREHGLDLFQSRPLRRLRRASRSVILHSPARKRRA